VAHVSSPSLFFSRFSFVFGTRSRFRVALDDVHSTTLQVLQAINCSIQRAQISSPRISRTRCVCGNGELSLERGICMRQRKERPNWHFCRKLVFCAKHLSNKCHVLSQYQFNAQNFYAILFEYLRFQHPFFLKKKGDKILQLLYAKSTALSSKYVSLYFSQHFFVLIILLLLTIIFTV